MDVQNLRHHYDEYLTKIYYFYKKHKFKKKLTQTNDETKTNFNIFNGRHIDSYKCTINYTHLSWF